MAINHKPKIDNSEIIYMSANYLEIVEQVAQNLEPIIEKIDSLEFCPWSWDESYHLLRELATAVEQIKNLNEQLESILLDDTFYNDMQNKAVVENIEEAYHCFDEFSCYFIKLESLVLEEGPKDYYETDYDYLSAQLKKAKQHLDQILT